MAGSKKRKGRPTKPALWIAIFDSVAVAGNPDTQTYKLFTVAGTKGEALRTFRDGLMGLPDVEGSPYQPRRIKRVAMPLKKTAAVVVHLMKRGALFVAPYERLHVEDVAMLAMHLLVKGGRCR